MSRSEKTFSMKLSSSNVGAWLLLLEELPPSASVCSWQASRYIDGRESVILKELVGLWRLTVVIINMYTYLNIYKKR